MNLKLTLALTAALVSTALVAQENILDMRENYNIGQTVTVTGVVTSDDNLGSVRYLQDATAGIALYPGQDWSAWEATPQIGDSLSVTGEITEYNGLLEVGPNLTDVTFFGQGTVPTPLEITPSQMGEDLEGQLVRINGVTFPLAGTFITGNNTYDFSSAGESGVIYVRTSNSLVGQELTGCEVDMLGIVSQFSFDGFGGYQLLPRGPVDLIPVSALCYTSPVSQTTGNACNRPTQNQSMHIMCAFIGVDRLQINGMSHDMIFLRDAIAAMHVARGAGNIQRLADIIALHDRHHFWGKPPLIHQPADPQASLIAKRNFALHIGQFFLVKLVGGQRFVKLVAFKTIGMGRVQAELRYTHRAPANAIARPVEAAKRPF